jgi:hypothetical protein
MKSLVLHFEDDVFEMMKTAKDKLNGSWDDVVEIAIAELYYYYCLKDEAEYERVS